MQIGSLVECVTDFSATRVYWKLNYPDKGDILTISNMEPHFRYKGLTLLYFAELPDFPTGICDKTAYGEDNFRELQPPIEIDIKECFPIEELC